MATATKKKRGNGLSKVASSADVGVPMEPIALQPLDLRTVEVPIVGETEYISHRWSDKAKRQMLEAQTSQTRKKKEVRDPQADYEGSLYRLEDGRCGIPQSAFKAAIVGGCRQFEGIAMVNAKVAIRPFGEGPEQLIPIVGEPRMREDMVRINNGKGTDLRYRGGFFPWSVILKVQYNAGMLTLDSLITLINAGGQGGVGDWRPSAPKSLAGSYGIFKVEG